MTVSNIDSSLAHRLIKTQFPQWAALPIKPVEFSGLDKRFLLLQRDSRPERLQKYLFFSMNLASQHHSVKILLQKRAKSFWMFLKSFESNDLVCFPVGDAE